MTRKSGMVAGAAVAVIALAGVWAGRTQTRYQRVVSALPPVPDLAALPGAFADALLGADARARGWRSAPQGLGELAQLYHANGRYPEAIACYDALEQLEPRDARWPHLHAAISADFGRLDEALPLRERAVALAPDYLPARLRLGDVLLKANRATDAVRAYEEVLRRDPSNPYALLGLARCDLTTNQWERARDRLQAAIAQHPGFIGGLSLLATVSEHLHDPATAEALRATIGRREFSDIPDPWLDALNDVCFDPYRLSVAAAVADAAGNRPTALELLDRAIALAPKTASYRRQAGQMLVNDQNFMAARPHLEKAVELNPADSDAWQLLINALRGLHQPDAAFAALQTALGHCPRSPSLHLELARYLQSTGQLDAAAGEFRRGYELRPSEASPLVELAGVYFALHRNDAALESLQKALERQPDHPMALATLTFYAISQRDEAAALARWAQVKRQPKTPGEVVQGLRAAYRQQFGRDLP